MNKAQEIISLLGLDDTKEALIDLYLSFAEKEICAVRRTDQMEPEYGTIQVFAVIHGFSQSGAEGQISHDENGIKREWKHEDMIAYIHNNVVPVAK